MARQIHRLTSIKVDKTKKPGMLSDGGGLYLRIAKSGSKSWIFRFMLVGKSREMGLGSLTKVSLKKARQKARINRELLDDGIDPIENSKALKTQQRLSDAHSMTFDQCAETYIADHKDGWSNPKHIQQWENTLATYASPVFGSLPIQEVDITLVLKVLEPIWKTKTETATRVRGRIEVILDWATVRGYRIGENPARWKGYLDKALPSPGKVTKIKHLAAMPYADLPKFFTKLQAEKGVAPKALEFTILTACRTSEVLLATWDEFNLDEKLWVIPADRMKARREHRVPLSEAALAILNPLKEAPLNEYVFPSVQRGKHLSNMAMTAVLRRMKLNNVTVHGFRSSFRDWIAEQTNTPNHVAEAALAHSIENKVEAAYRRGDLFAKRAKLMEDWARYMEAQEADVVSISDAKKA